MLLRSLAAVPRGRLTTYGALARLAGRPRSARWVGRVLATLPTDSTLPWHRVVNAAGRISLPAGSPAAAEQARRLSREGIEVSDAGRVPLARLRWP